MKRILLPVIFLALISCKEISYKEPQPKGRKALNEIPKKLQGKYLFPNEDGSTNDTLVVTSQAYFSLQSPKEGGMLSDTLILKKYKGYYFLNINQHPEWVLRVIKKEKNGDLLFMSMDDKNFNSFLKKLGKEIRIDSTVVQDEKLYQIDPTPKQIVRLIEKKFFNLATRIKKIK